MKVTTQEEEENALSILPGTARSSRSESNKIQGSTWGNAPVKLALATDKCDKRRNRSSDSSPARSRKLSSRRMKTRAYGSNDVASSFTPPQVSSATGWSSQMRSCSPWNQQITEKTTGANPQRRPAPWQSSNTAKTAGHYGMGGVCTSGKRLLDLKEEMVNIDKHVYPHDMLEVVVLS